MSRTTDNGKDADTGRDTLADHVLMTRSEVLEVVPYSMAHIYRMERVGGFPRRVKVGPRRIGWRRREIHAWLAGRPLADLRPDDKDLL